MSWDREREELERDADFYRSRSEIWSDKVDELDDALGRSDKEREHEDAIYNYRQDEDD